MPTTIAPEEAPDQTSEVYSSEMGDENADRVSTGLPDTWTAESVSHLSQEDKGREYNKRLLVSLGMLLPAIAAIIGVVAWAISAEVVMGAKREAARRQSESTLRLHNNRFDYSRFTSVPLHQLPTKEMLVDHSSQLTADGSLASRPPESLNILQHHLEELSRDYLARRMDNEPAESGDAKAKQQAEVNDKIKSVLTHENLSQLLKKLLSSQKVSSNANPPQIVMVAPLASHKNVSKPQVETKVTTTRPKALELKISPAKEQQEKSKKGRVQLDSVKRRVTQAPPTTNKKRTSGSASKKTNQNLHRTTTTTSTKAPTTKSAKNYKAKIYEKEIDILLQKIEKLEKQQKITPEKSNIPENIANNKLLNGKPADIAEKIKSFMSGDPSKPTADQKQEPEVDGGEWSGDFPPYPPPPLPPPLPFMPMMPPPPPPMPGQEMSAPAGQEASMPGQYPPMPVDTYPRDSMHVEPSNEQYHSMANGHMPGHMNAPYGQQPPGQQAVQQYQDNLPVLAHQTQQQHQQYPQHQVYSHASNLASQTYQSSHYEPSSPNVDATPSNRKKNKGGIFKRKFKLSSIFNSVIPKSKKKEEPKPQSDNRNINIGPSGQIEPMMVQESQMHSHVDRGNGYYEQPGMQMSFGGGPMGGGGQFKASPMGILKTLVLPLLPKPRMNLNGKVVFGVVLENGVGFGKKPKTVFQHFSTGRI